MQPLRLTCLTLIVGVFVTCHAAVAANYALVIGINDYIATIENLPTLTYAVPDAEAVKQELEKIGFTVVSLTNSEAVRDRIVAQLAKYSRELRAEDTLLIYFAGHGVRQSFGERAYSYWLTHDSVLARLDVDAIRINHLMDYVIDIPTNRRIIILDHCHSGDVDFQQAVAGAGRDATGGLSLARNAFALDDFNENIREAVAEGIVILGAATATAYEYADLGHGVLTFAFLEALRSPAADTDNNGILSTDELRNHVMSRTREIATEKDSVQNPIEYGAGAVTWDFAILGNSALDVLLDELANHLDPEVLLRCFEALENFENSVASDNDLKLVEDMRVLATSESSASTKARFLKSKVNSLPP